MIDMTDKDKLMGEALEAAHAAIKDLSLRVVEKASVRDQFAMAALSGALAGRVTGERTEWAKAAYEIADAMIAARSEK